ncbi:MAG: Flp pilus assembly complex ATPase component TadA [Pelotomaculum sp.]|uniref:Type II secretory pathway, ATPase PulE/tfp pilus assembly pathway, ATPase PilB n=1 Tax=Pelotomaculum thermopropionicum (strain DSM 13744 / JCM 10971 / SI) TaxID=370438 RepID=A5D353_PELTS|nr:Flp pilus assembly complex ATPase component TadA [Pelotomaculum sp.]BAF59326.1 type II secretory pathway, ATPase PulE/tfp pilus assembly pathway, ATPase PilB [Pelotomaculum thermopropionicum SI]
MKNGQKSNLLGEWLVREGVITREQLEEVLNRQDFKKQKMLLGKRLVQLGYCTEDDVSRVIAKRAGIPFVSLENYSIDAAAVSTVPPDAIKRYKALPVGFDQDKLVVAIQHPNNIVALDDLRILTGYEIKPVVVPDSELEVAIEKYTRAGMDFDLESEGEPQLEDEAMEADDLLDRPAVQLANMILSQAVSAKASDIHIEPFEKQLRVRFRIDGVLHDVMQPPKKLHPSLVSRIKVMANMDIAERRVPQDGRMSLKIDGKAVDVRVASLPGSFGERLTLRLLDRSGSIMTLEKLGLVPAVLKKFRARLSNPYGFILVTGPTGSGKSTTLYASLASINTVEKNVITVEDPVEYRIEGINQVQINPKAGLTFATGLRSILRNDPDIIMVGEIRDRETATIAVEAALTGHLVLATLHTNEAAGAISRLLEMGIEPYLIASSLVCVLAQRLARVLCPSCKVEHYMSREELKNIEGFPLEENESGVKIYRPGSCMRCSNTGYRGRIGVFELLDVSEKIQRLTLEKRSAAEIKEAAVGEGMITLRQDGLMKVRQGITSLEEILRVVM